MRIGVIGTIWLNTPPQNYGGTERVVYNLVNGLVDKGQDVTLFGPATSKTKAKLVSTVPIPLRDAGISWDDKDNIVSHITKAFDMARDFDVLHMHLNKFQDYIALDLAQKSKIPVVFTTHFLLPSPSFKKDRYDYLQRNKNLPFISISNSQRKDSNLNFIKTVYNGLELDNYKFIETPSDYFLWLGRIDADKGTKEAILAAKKAGEKLLVAGILNTNKKENVDYFEKEVKPLIDGKQIQWIGKVSMDKKVETYGRARAFLNPIEWEEPFGLVMIEAQACGTPVISFPRGAAPEIVVDGKNGFLVKDIVEMAEKMKKLDIIDRGECRQSVVDNFSVEKMTEGYLESYKIAIKNWDSYISKREERVI